MAYRFMGDEDDATAQAIYAQAVKASQQTNQTSGMAELFAPVTDMFHRLLDSVVLPTAPERDNDVIIDRLPNAAHENDNVSMTVTGVRPVSRPSSGGGGMLTNPNTLNTSLPGMPPSTPAGGLAAVGAKLGMNTNQTLIFLAMAAVGGYLVLRRRK